MKLTAHATRTRLEEVTEAPGFTRTVLMTLAIGDQSLTVPVDDKRTLDTLNKRLPTAFVVTIEEAS